MATGNTPADCSAGLAPLPPPGLAGAPHVDAVGGGCADMFTPSSLHSAWKSNFSGLWLKAYTIWCAAASR